MFLPNAGLAGSQLNKGPALCHLLLHAAGRGEINSRGGRGNEPSDSSGMAKELGPGASSASMAAANGTWLPGCDNLGGGGGGGMIMSALEHNAAMPGKGEMRPRQAVAPGEAGGTGFDTLKVSVLAAGGKV